MKPFGTTAKLGKKTSSFSKPKVVAKSEKTEKLVKKIVKVSKKSYDEDDEDDDLDVAPTPKVARDLALVSAPKLGIQSFEVERDSTPETFLPEGVDDEDRQHNARKNDEKLIAPTKLIGSNDNKVRNIVTLFGQRADSILRLLENEDETDGALTLIHRTLLQTLVDVLPVVERAVRRSKGRHGVIPMNQLVSQMRELVTDIQALRDKGQLGASIVERVVRPAYLDIASQIALAFLEIENSAKNRMTNDDFVSYRSEVLQFTKKNLAHYIQAQYENIKNEVVNSLS